MKEMLICISCNNTVNPGAQLESTPKINEGDPCNKCKKGTMRRFTYAPSGSVPPTETPKQKLANLASLLRGKPVQEKLEIIPRVCQRADELNFLFAFTCDDGFTYVQPPKKDPGDKRIIVSYQFLEFRKDEDEEEEPEIHPLLKAILDSIREKNLRGDKPPEKSKLFDAVMDMLKKQSEE